MNRRICTLAALCLWGIHPCQGQAESLDIVPEWTVEETAQILEETRDTRMFPAIGDRPAWGALRARLGEEWIETLVARAESELGKEIPNLPASLFLDFHRTGTRVNYQRAYSGLRGNLGTLALAECFENQGRFLDEILDRSWRTCELMTWELPAHTKDLPLPGERGIDLVAVDVASELSMLVSVMEEVLYAALVKRIRYEVDERVFTPYLDPDRTYSWERSRSNWNAVCNGGVIAAALALDAPQATAAARRRTAEIITKAQHGIRRSLLGFGGDGGTNEGVSYWSYGFGNFVRTSFLLERRTGGRLTLLDGGHVRKVALFPVNCQLSPGRYPSFSDAALESRIPYTIAFGLAERLALPILSRAAIGEGTTGPPQQSNFVWALLTIAIDPESVPVAEATAPPLSNYLSGVQWWVARAQPEDAGGLVLAAKSGHNGEMHNHNDVGSFIVHWNRESLLVDPGAPVYTRDFFRSDKRYDYFAASSRGHSVPVVNKCFQTPGAEHRGKVLDRSSNESSERLIVDLTEAYGDEAGLDSLVRTFELSRAGRGSVTVADDVRFKTDRNRLEETLITFAAVERVGPGKLRVIGENGALSVTYEPEDAEVEIETYDNQETQLRVDHSHVYRIVFRVEGGDARMQFTITLEG